MSLWTRWRTCRHVYRFDRALSRELASTAAPDTMPIEVIHRLPYPIIYVDAPVYVVTTRDSRIDAAGFFAYMDTAMDADDKPAESLTIVYVTPGCWNGTTAVHLCLRGAETLGDVVDELTRSDEKYMGSILEGHREHVRDCIVCALNHILYIIDAQSDQSVTYVPSKAVSQKRAKQTSRSTIHSVGARIGKALGAARVRYETPRKVGESGRKSPRAHMRAGHWSHYWTGPRKGPEPQTVVVRWIAPTMVGVGESEQTTVHAAEK
jgi:hypothetical protein